MRTLLKTVITLVTIAAIIVVGLLSLAGFVPYLSKWVGADQPRDLGAAVTEQDLISSQAKLGQTFIALSDIRSVNNILAGGTSTPQTTLTARELAAHIQAIHPVTDLQIVFTPNGGFEASGRIEKTRLVHAARLLGYTNVTEASVLNALGKYFPKGGVFYMRGQGQIVDDEIIFSLVETNIGRLPVSSGGLEEALEQYAKLMLQRIPGLSVREMKIVNQELIFNGTVPKQLPSFE